MTLRLFGIVASSLSIFFLSTSIAWADVAITASNPRDYTLPAGFALPGSLVIAQGEDTYIVNNVGDGNAISCVVIRATPVNARSFTYRVNNTGTACVGFAPHPTNGFFLRTHDPTAIEGTVTGNTSWIDANGVEQWRVSDQRLVEAEPAPGGTGSLQGRYYGVMGPLLYSAAVDRVLGATLGNLQIGFDEKFIAQHHLINAQTGALVRTGIVFGQSGVGIPISGLVKENGDFLIALDTLGLDGTIFFTYDGRESVEQFLPLNESWSGRRLIRLGYTENTATLLWTEDVGENVPAHIASTNAQGAPFFRTEFETTYRFANGDFVFLGLPLNLHLSRDYAIISYSWDGVVYLRFVDKDGESPGMARIQGFPMPPISLVQDDKGGVRLLTSSDGKVVEYDLTFEDVADYDPNAILEDAELPDITVDDVLDEAGCGCNTSPNQAPTALFLAFFAFLSFRVIRRVST